MAAGKTAALSLKKGVRQRDPAGHKKRRRKVRRQKEQYKDMEKKFITQDDVLGFLEDWMNIPAESRTLELRFILSDNPDGTIELGMYEGPKRLRGMTIIPDNLTLKAKEAMKYLLDGGRDDE